jgi:non-canonical (house-cleaning) NTP pyrophosphatase
MNTLICALSLVIALTFSVLAAENLYLQQYGSAEIISASQAYPDFYKVPAVSPVANHIHVVIASDKQVKIDAVIELFARNHRFDGATKTFSSIKVSSDIADQPLGITNGRLGALNRINQAMKMRDIQHRYNNVYICSIENYFESDNVEAPRDHAFVMVQSPDSQLFEAVSVGVAIHRDIFDAATRGATRLRTGYSKTVGTYLNELYGFDGSDWFKDVLCEGKKLGRIDQILTTLDEGEWF